MLIIIINIVYRKYVVGLFRSVLVTNDKSVIAISIIVTHV